MGQKTVNRVFVAFAAIYLAWGSTYLAIRFALESIPPFLLAGFHFFLAGSVLLGWSLFNGISMPQPKQCIAAAIGAILLIVLGHGGVVMAERTLPSGLVSLLMAMAPVYFVLLEWWQPGGSVPGKQTVSGLAIGLAGLLVLIGPANLLSGHNCIDIPGLFFATMGTVCWSIGSVYASRANISDSPGMTLALQSLIGGTILLLVSFALYEPQHFSLSAVSTRSALSLIYLIIVDSLIGFAAYFWLLKKVKPTLVATHTFVNPVVAVLLGWALAREILSAETIIATVLILLAVWAIQTARVSSSKTLEA